MFEPRPTGLIISSCYHDTITVLTYLVRLGSCSKQVVAVFRFVLIFFSFFVFDVETKDNKLIYSAALESVVTYSEL